MGMFSLLDLFGSKQNVEGFSPNIHQPYEYFAPQTQSELNYSFSPQYQYAVQIGSPDATIESKKADRTSQTAEQEATQKNPITSGTETTDKSPNWTLIGLGGLAVLGIVMVIK